MLENGTVHCSFTFDTDLVFSIRLRQDIHIHDHLANCIHSTCCKDTVRKWFIGP